VPFSKAKCPLIEEATPMSAPTLAFKGVAVDEGAESPIVDINEAEGIVTAVVSVTGTKDDVDDVIEPGAYADTLKVRNPKICWHHSWEKPVGRTLHIEELMPGDSRLPAKQRNGQPWPKEAGALVATMQFNMKSERGREAFEAVRFYSESGECEWSIGYQVPKGTSRTKNGIRYLKVIDLFELSFVLFGAHNMTGTLALKAAVLAMHVKSLWEGKQGKDETVAVSKDEFEQVLKGLTAEDDYDDTDEDEDPEDGKAAPAKPDDEDDDKPPADAPPIDAPAAEVTDVPDGEIPVDAAPEDGENPADAPADDPGDPIEDEPGEEQEVLLFENDEGIPEEDADEEDDEAPKPAAKALESARLVLSKSLPSDADTDIESICTCGDAVVFDTMNGWMRKDGSYSHNDGTTHSNHLEPPSAEELMEAGVKGWTFDDYLTALLTDGINQELGKAFKIDLSPLGEIKANTGDQPGNAAELIEWYERGEGAAKIRWGEKGDFMRCVRIAKKHMTEEQAKGFCSNRHLGALGVRPGQEGGKAYPADSDLGDPLAETEDDKDPNDPHETGVMVALFPSPDVADQLIVRGGEKAEDLHVTLAYLGKTSDDVGDGQTLGGSVGRIFAACQIAAATHQTLSGSIGGLGRFPDTGDGVPVWAPVDVVGLGALRESVVTALIEAGLPVKTDHGFTPHMTLGYNLDPTLIPMSEGVPVTFDKLVIACGGERMEVPLGQDPDVPVSNAPVAGEPLNPPLDSEAKAMAYDPTIETGADAGHRPAVSSARKMFPYLEGTYEERQAALEQALREALVPTRDDDDEGEGIIRPMDYGLNIDGTWPDRVVCTVHDWSAPGHGDRQSWEVPYSFDEDGGVVLGKPEKVKLSVTAVDEDGGELTDVPVGDMLPLAEGVEFVTAGLRNAIGGTEVKAGRVLSTANALRLRSAVEHLISVLAAAGIEVGDATDREKPSNPTVDDETTAPSARDAGSKALSAADVANDLSQFTDVL
jgi:2'-5' RNA ligase